MMLRMSVLLLWSAFSLHALGCSSPDQGSCSPASCAGCCTEEGVCMLGMSSDLCGADGATCTACGDSQACVSGQCTSATCGDGTRQLGERCDLNDFGGATCEGLGRGDGMLACTATCEFDLSGCSVACGPSTCAGCCGADGRCYPGTTASRCGHDAAICTSCAPDEICDGVCTNVGCGNGMREGEEACDGADLGTATCASLGFLDGSLGCTSTCTYNVDDCTGNPCAFDEAHE